MKSKIMTLAALLIVPQLGAQVLHPASFQLVDDAGQTLLVITDSGEVRHPESEREIGRIHSDGKVFRAGQLVAALASEGALNAPTGDALVYVDKDGGLDNGVSALSWTEDGNLQGADEVLGLQMVPYTTSQRRLASVAAFVFLNVIPSLRECADRVEDTLYSC